MNYDTDALLDRVWMAVGMLLIVLFFVLCGVFVGVLAYVVLGAF